MSVSLWPPDHEFEVIDLAALGAVVDPDGDPVTLQIVSVTQDESVFGGGPDDNTSPDAVVDGPSIVRLRRERAGDGNGRVYRVAFRATDGHGGGCQDTLSVQVPLDQGVKAAEDPLSFESVATQVVGVGIGSSPSGWALWTKPSPSRGAGTTLEFLIEDSRHEGIGVLTIRDVAGRNLRSWSLGQVTSGRHRIIWDERARDGTRVNVGVYFVQLQVAGAALTRTHIVLK
jgi:hypothetical protein